MDLPEPTRLSPTDLQAIEELTAGARLRLARARSRLYGRMSHPDSLFDGESWRVDLSVPRFDGLMNDEVVSTGPAQLLATWSEGDGSWLWGDRNPSVGDVPGAELAKALDDHDHPAIRAVRAHDRFLIEHDLAERLAQWCAVEHGCLGAWPGPQPPATAYLALKLTVSPDHDPEPAANPWCSFCGRWPNQVEYLLAGEDTYLCDLCLDLFAEMTDGGSGTNPPPEMVGCLMCGGNGPRVFTAWGALCGDCVTTAGKALATDR